MTGVLCVEPQQEEASEAERRMQERLAEEAAARKAEEQIRRTSAAIRIQSLFRGVLARSRVASFRQRRLKELEDEALSGAPKRRNRRMQSKRSVASEASSQG